ncbi:MAG: outer membrane beta-barrel protein [Candidatus Aminicenantes bacterium]|nr:outer membrane beta-barrel protein [Candidatus Aminicenantes bacterium]
MKKKLWLMLLSLFLVVSGYAAGVKPGLRFWGGATMSRYVGTPILEVSIPETSYKNSWRTDINLGAGLEFKVSQTPLAFILDLGYLEKGTNLDIYYLDIKTGSLPYSLGTLSQMGLARVNFSGKWSPYLLAGYELAFVLKHRGELFGLSEPDLKSDSKKTDFCLVAGAGLEFKGQKMSPFLEVCYHHGLVNLSRMTGSLEYYPSIKSRALVFNAGFKFGKS